MYIITWKLKLQRRRVEEVLLELIKLNNILKELYSKKFFLTMENRVGRLSNNTLTVKNIMPPRFMGGFFCVYRFFRDLLVGR